jgi:hypothetical protein
MTTPPTDEQIAQARRETGWTDTRELVLIWAWGEGKSAAQIAAIIGGVSRNSAIGKAHRLGLTKGVHATLAKPSAPRRQTGGFGEPGRTPAPRVNPRLAIAGNGAVFEKSGNDRPPREIIPARLEQPGKATLMSLTIDSCRWPIGEGAGITFCGRKKREPGSYCAEHAAIAYRPHPTAKPGKKADLFRSIRRYL